jgi:3'-phosphoadenosine 5'-phosphosulfate sulfotransferase
MLPRCHGSVNLHMERARTRDLVAWTRHAKINQEREKRLQTQATYIADVRVGESSTKMEERLQTQTIY